MQIIDGYCGAPNVYADDIGEYHVSVYGAGDYVLAVGEQLGYELISNNEIQIKDGIFITQGRRGLIKKGTAESCIIENGTQAESRNDLIVIEYAKDETTQIESHTLKVIKGSPGEKSEDPDIITGDIPSGAILHQMPLYRVKLSGLSIVAVEQMFTIGTIAPETADPMTTTEEGFAADAKLTGDALKELNANLEISMSNLVNLKDLFDDLNTAFQKIISGFVGSQSGTYTPPGTIEGVVRQADYTVNFPKAFSAIPSVVASGYVLYQNKNYPCTVSILSRTKSGFTCRVYCADGLSPRPTINWTASI